MSIFNKAIWNNLKEQYAFWCENITAYREALLWLRSSVLTMHNDETRLGHFRVRHMERTGGFTILELLFVVAITAILVAMGVPSFVEIVKRNRIDSEVNSFVTTLNTARSEAVVRNTRTTMCRSSNGTSCTGDWEDGWIVFVDSANVGTVDGGEEILVVGDGMDRNRFTLRGNTNVSQRISFGAEGYSAGSNGQLALCYDDDNNGSGDFDDDNAKVIIISNSGRIRTLDTTDADVTISSCTP